LTSFISSDPRRDLDGSERRGDPRRALRANAELLVAGGKLEVRTLDISTSGIGIAASINPRVNQTFSILLAPVEDPRGTARIEMAVSVVHSILTQAEGEFKIGLRFGQLSPAALELVKKYLRG
jgi:c-di-GMP-binding flagellar brake protein YcgR